MALPARCKGEMAEWLKAHAWKACSPKGVRGSNPRLSAIQKRKPAHLRWLLHLKSWDQACLRTGASMQKRIRPEAGVAFSFGSTLSPWERVCRKARAIPVSPRKTEKPMQLHRFFCARRRVKLASIWLRAKKRWPEATGLFMTFKPPPRGNASARRREQFRLFPY